MKAYILPVIVFMASCSCHAQDTTSTQTPYSSFQRHTSIITVSFGLADWNKQNYKKPDSTTFGSGSTSLPVYLKLERAIGKHISITASLAYDVFYYNYSHPEVSNGKSYYLQYSDKVRIVSPGLQLSYHFNDLIPIRNLDVFITAGGAANFVHHDSYLHADTSSHVTRPTIDPLVRLGARYYINKHAAFFGDVGYDRISLISLGFSYRIFGKLL
ncbi:MAG: hypothetical protein H0X33_02745 [Taibaiella sp.]|nr:hypothetical protein [Taibaiella sp.]